MDERLLTKEKCEVLFNSKYDGEYIFAFDNINDAAVIESKLKLIREYTDKQLKFYVFCGFDRNGKWDKDFWRQDLWDLWKRIEILFKYNACPYIMRFERYVESPYMRHYISLARWCNQPQFLKTKSFEEFSTATKLKSGKPSSDHRNLEYMKHEMPELADKYFGMKYGD